MRVCKYLKQSFRKIGEQNGKYFKGVSKIKKKFKSSYYRLPVPKKSLGNA